MSSVYCKGFLDFILSTASLYSMLDSKMSVSLARMDVLLVYGSLFSTEYGVIGILFQVM